MSYIDELLQNSLQSNNYSNPDASIDCIGAQVQQLRKERAWSLDHASKVIEISRSALIKIEKGQMSPTFEVIKKIAAGFNLSVTQLLAPLPDENTITTTRFSITRKNEGEINDQKYERQEFLASALLRKKMFPYKGIIKAKQKDEVIQWVRHDGEEFMIVLSGQVMFCTEHYKAAILSPGDSVYFDAKMGHFTYSISEGDAEVLWVMTK